MARGIHVTEMDTLNARMFISNLNDVDGDDDDDEIMSIYLMARKYFIDCDLN